MPLIAHGQGFPLIIAILVGLLGISFVIVGSIFYYSRPGNFFARKLAESGLVAVILVIAIWPVLVKFARQ